MSDKCNCPTCTQARIEAARECAEIVRKFMISDHYPIGMNEARDAILRKFGIESDLCKGEK